MLMCQRPERASFISTQVNLESSQILWTCQRPERASFISTIYAEDYLVIK